MSAPGNPGYGLVERHTNNEGVGIAGAVTRVPERSSSTWRGPTRAEGYDGHVTIYIEVPGVEAALAKAESLGGKRMQGPDAVPEAGIEMAKCSDPARLVKSTS